MKKIKFFIVLSIINFYGFAQNSNLTVSTTGTTNLKIRFNGKRYSLTDRNVTFQNISPGAYPMVIYQLQRKNNGTEYVEVFNNNVTLTANKHLEVTVLRFGKTAWDEGYIESEDWNDGYINPNGSSNNSGNTGQIVDDEIFQKMKKTIKDAYYDNDMLTTGKGVIKGNYLSCKQIIELCKLFSYDDGKLKFAKYAYDYCSDKGSYFTVTDVFYYDNNKKDLMTFISNK